MRNSLTERTIAVMLICILLMSYYVYDSMKMRDENKDISELNAVYEEDLNTYLDLLDTEVDKNTQLSADIDELEDKLVLLENQLEAFRNEHADCRIPIVYSSENVLTPSNVTAEELDRGLRYNLQGYGQYFVEAEKQYGINAIFLASIAAHESGWGRSALAINKNNLFGYKQAGGGGSFREFSSVEECILYVAQVLKTSYLTEGAKYYNGTSVTAINIKYCSSKDWAPQVNLIAKKIMDKIVED